MIYLSKGGGAVPIRTICGSAPGIPLSKKLKQLHISHIHFDIWIEISSWLPELLPHLPCSGYYNLDWYIYSKEICQET